MNDVLNDDGRAFGAGNGDYATTRHSDPPPHPTAPAARDRQSAGGSAAVEASPPSRSRVVGRRVVAVVAALATLGAAFAENIGVLVGADGKVTRPANFLAANEIVTYTRLATHTAPGLMQVAYATTTGGAIQPDQADQIVFRLGWHSNGYVVARGNIVMQGNIDTNSPNNGVVSAATLLGNFARLDHNHDTAYTPLTKLASGTEAGLVLLGESNAVSGMQSSGLSRYAFPTGIYDGRLVARIPVGNAGVPGEASVFALWNFSTLSQSFAPLTHDHPAPKPAKKIFVLTPPYGTLVNGRAIADFELKGLRGDGSYAYVYNSGDPLSFGANRPVVRFTTSNLGTTPDPRRHIVQGDASIAEQTDGWPAWGFIVEIDIASFPGGDDVRWVVAYMSPNGFLKNGDTVIWFPVVPQDIFETPETSTEPENQTNE